MDIHIAVKRMYGSYARNYNPMANWMLYMWYSFQTTIGWYEICTVTMIPCVIISRYPYGARRQPNHRISWLFG